MSNSNIFDYLRRYIGKLALRILLWSYGFSDRKSWEFYNVTGASINMFHEWFKR